MIKKNLLKLPLVIIFVLVFFQSEADEVPVKIKDNFLNYDVMVCNNCLVADEYWQFTTNCNSISKYELKICTECLSGQLSVRVCDNDYICKKVDKVVCVTNPDELQSKTLRVLGID